MTREEVSRTFKDSELPPVHVVEQWGNTPFFSGPSWRISWALQDEQSLQISRTVANGSLWEATQSCFQELSRLTKLYPKLNIIDNPCNQLTNSVHLQVIADLAQAFISPAQIEICPPLLAIKLQPACLVLRSDEHELAGRAIAAAAQLIRGVLLGIDSALPVHGRHSLLQALTDLILKANACCAHPLTMAQLAEAHRRAIPVFLLDPSQRLYQLGSGMHSRWISSTSNDRDSAFGVILAKDKTKSHDILRQLGLPVPREIRLPWNVTDTQLCLATEKLGFPCVLKPQDAEQGRGVTANIKSNDELLAAAKKAKRYTSNQLLLQEHIEGSDHRLNVVNGGLGFVVKRSAPFITGNGRDTVLELINAENIIRRKLRKEDGVSAEVNPEEEDILSRLGSAGVSLNTILKAGQVIVLRDNANISTGGLREELDVATVHPRIRRQCEAIALTLRLDVCGIDYITPDITADPDQCRGAFVEINSMPQNSPKRAPDILDNLFPLKSENSIKVITIISTWEAVDLEAAKARLREEINKHPGATISFHRQLSDKLRPFLADLPSQTIHAHSHPREPLLNKMSSSVVYLTTPELTLQKGLAPSHRHEVICWCSETDLHPRQAWQAFLEMSNRPNEMAVNVDRCGYSGVIS